MNSKHLAALRPAPEFWPDRQKELRREYGAEYGRVPVFAWLIQALKEVDIEAEGAGLTQQKLRLFLFTMGEVYAARQQKDMTLKFLGEVIVGMFDQIESLDFAALIAQILAAATAMGAGPGAHKIPLPAARRSLVSDLPRVPGVMHLFILKYAHTVYELKYRWVNKEQGPDWEEYLAEFLEDSSEEEEEEDDENMEDEEFIDATD